MSNNVGNWVSLRAERGHAESCSLGVIDECCLCAGEGIQLTVK